MVATRRNGASATAKARTCEGKDTPTHEKRLELERQQKEKHGGHRDDQAGVTCVRNVRLKRGRRRMRKKKMMMMMMIMMMRGGGGEEGKEKGGGESGGRRIP